MTVLEQIISDMDLLAIHGADLDECEMCGKWMTYEEAYRAGDATLCPHQAYGGPRFPNAPCYRDRPWRLVHQMGFDQAEAVRRTAELMAAEQEPTP